MRNHETTKKNASTSITNTSYNVSEDQKIGRLKIYAALTVSFLIIAIGVSWILYSASQVPTERFSIYLVETNEVTISDEEIMYYIKTSHEIKLAQEGAEKIEQLSLKVPMNGTKFMIKINGKEIYGGWFWSPISSIPCSSVVIETTVRNETIKIETGYPSSHFQGEDPRNNPTVFNYFQAAGKLVD